MFTGMLFIVLILFLPHAEGLCPQVPCMTISGRSLDPHSQPLTRYMRLSCGTWVLLFCVALNVASTAVGGGVRVAGIKIFFMS